MVSSRCEKKQRGDFGMPMSGVWQAKFWRQRSLTVRRGTKAELFQTVGHVLQSIAFRIISKVADFNPSQV